MLLRSRMSAFVVLALGLAYGCSGDEKKVEEPVQPAATQEPATPPETSAAGTAQSVTAQPVYFAFDDYTLNSDSQASLSTLANQMKTAGTAVIQIEGHCDERGSNEYNLALGDRRASAVKGYLTQLGVDGSRLTTVSYGEERAAADGHEESSWSRNRRAEFVISSK